MSYEIDYVEAGELIDLAETLHNAYGNVTDAGVLIDKQNTGWTVDVAYSLPETPEEPFKVLSTTAYTAEFFKACGGNLQDTDFDKVVAQCQYVGRVMAEPMIHRGFVSFEDLRVMWASPPKPKTDTRSLAELAGNARCLDDDGRRGIL